MPTSSLSLLRGLLPEYLEVVSDRWDGTVTLHTAEVRDIETGIVIEVKSMVTSMHTDNNRVYFAYLRGSRRSLAMFSTLRPLSITHDEFMRRVLIKSVS
jgi:hypothetical protein